MIGHLDIEPLRTAGLDYKEAEDLKHTFRNIREVRIPFFLTRDELEKIFRWKLIGQYGRTKALRDVRRQKE